MKSITSFLLFFLTATIAYAGQADTLIGLKAEAAKDYRQLTYNICKTAKTDKEKANAIYNWVTHNIALDIEANMDPDRDPPEISKILKTGMAANDGYTLLYSRMCQEMGLDVVVVSGYAKDWIFDNRDEFLLPRHSWCAVLINDKWELVDPLYGAGYIEKYKTWFQSQVDKLSKPKLEYGTKERFKMQYNPTYFMYDVFAFRHTHLPADPMWQLTQTPMPLEVFELGDSAVSVFNETHRDVQQDNAALLHIARLDEKEKILDYAKRVYDCNNRFKTVLYEKEFIEAGRGLQQINNKQRSRETIAVLQESRDKLKKSDSYLKEQKKTFPQHYAELQKKNAAKNIKAKEYIRTIKTDDKLLMAKCKRYANNVDKEISDLRKTYDELQKRKEGLHPEKLSTITTSKKQKPNDAVTIAQLTDSINKRNDLVGPLTDSITTLQRDISMYVMNSQVYWEQMFGALGDADSFITSEAYHRIMLRDDYDDEVIACNKNYRVAKFSKADTLQVNYMSNYDSITALQDRVNKLHLAILDIYKNNIRDIERYKKIDSTATDILGAYSKMVLDYNYGIGRFSELLSDNIEYQQANYKIFYHLLSVYKRETEIVDKMETAEEERKKEEARMINQQKSFDERDNARLQRNVETALKEVDKSLQSL